VFSFGYLPDDEFAPHTRINIARSLTPAAGADRRKLVHQIFLNCTTNIELTARAFPRTFSLVPGKNQSHPRNDCNGRGSQGKDTQAKRHASKKTLLIERHISQLSTHNADQLAGMNMNPWITYRTRFLVKAKQLDSSLVFTDLLGREHSGQQGDYLVESGEGIFRIAPRKIFEDIYVPMSDDPSEPSLHDEWHDKTSPQITMQPWPILPARNFETRNTGPIQIPPLAKKSPQPCRERHNSLPGMGSV
jgi:hypothetical protein